jgi:hypothetical protein
MTSVLEWTMARQNYRICWYFFALGRQGLILLEELPLENKVSVIVHIL